MDTLITIKGILKNPWVEGDGLRRYVRNKYVARHNPKNPEELKAACDVGMMDLINKQGLAEVIDENKSAKDPTNLRFWPISMFRYFDTEVKDFTVAIPEKMGEDTPQ